MEFASPDFYNMFGLAHVVNKGFICRTRKEEDLYLFYFNGKALNDLIDHVPIFFKNIRRYIS